jgi:hypothetical protein
LGTLRCPLFLQNPCNLTRCKLTSCSFNALRAGDSMEPIQYPSPFASSPDCHPVSASPPLAVSWAEGVTALSLEAQGLGPAALAAAGSPLISPSTPSAAAAAYLSGLARGGQRADARRSSAASRQEFVVVSEFSAWLRQLPPSWGRCSATVVPGDLVAYFESHWVGLHGRTLVGPSTDPVASASGVKGALLCLEHYFNAIGRSGDWFPPYGGNPCRSPQVRDWLAGYRREHWVDGVRPTAATPMTHAMVELMVTIPVGTVIGGADTAPPPGRAQRPRKLPSPEVREAHHRRDCAMVHYLFESGQRAGEGSRLRWCDIEPSPLTWGRDGVPESVVLRPNGIKTCQQRNAGQATLWSVARPAEQTRASEFLWMLPALMAASAAAGVPPQADGPVFLQLSGAGYKLSPKPATYAVAKRIVAQRAAHCGLAQQVLTGHSSRRGRIQEDDDFDLADGVTQSRLLGICSQTLKLYRSRTRPTRCLEATVVPDLVPLAPAPSPPAGVAGLVRRTFAWFARA